MINPTFDKKEHSKWEYRIYTQYLDDEELKSENDWLNKGGKEGGAYAACLSAEKARKLGPKGRASFVRRKRAAQKKGGDPKKGGERRKGQKTIKVKTGA